MKKWICLQVIVFTVGFSAYAKGKNAYECAVFTANPLLANLNMPDLRSMSAALESVSQQVLEQCREFSSAAGYAEDIHKGVANAGSYFVNLEKIIYGTLPVEMAKRLMETFLINKGILKDVRFLGSATLGWRNVYPSIYRDNGLWGTSLEAKLTVPFYLHVRVIVFTNVTPRSFRIDYVTVKKQGDELAVSSSMDLNKPASDPIELSDLFVSQKREGL